jgi:FAD/FMN-containing dehydrogenase
LPDPTTFDPARLRDAASGDVILAGDDGYDEARQAFNLMIDQRPAAVAMAADAEDVAAIVRFAREHGKRVAPQRTGHNAGPLGSLEDTILVKTDALSDVQIDAGARRARVGGGAQWQDLVPQASQMGLAALHGSAPDIGIAGYTLGGGMGWYARKLGLAANSVTALEVVTGSGEQVRADADSEPELFWALRGGGGNFGIVTALEFELYPIESVYAGILFFPYDRASEVLHAWREWVDGVPDEVTSVGRMLQFPPFEEVPEHLRGQQFSAIEAACLMPEAEAVELLAPLRELGPAMDTFESVPPEVLSHLHMDPPMPVPYLSCHELLADAPAEAIDAIVEAVGPGTESPLISVELRHTGGALERVGDGHGALSCVPGSFLAFGVGATPVPPAAEAVEHYLLRLSEALAPHACGRYLNFVEEAYDLEAVFGDDLERLRAAKAKYDPDGVMHANHPVTTTP